MKGCRKILISLVSQTHVVLMIVDRQELLAKSDRLTASEGVALTASPLHLQIHAQLVRAPAHYLMPLPLGEHSPSPHPVLSLQLPHTA